ncbi:MAG: methyltransferase domain-containing protein [Proteobacteria bacterium]|nr:methyltransferase domain-containing protein [Pseudomonadota bacterium]
MNGKPDLLPRRMAAAILGDVLDNKKPLDGCLEAVFANNKALGVRDRAFLRQLVATSLRQLGNIDAILAKKLKKPLPRRAGMARHILRLGIAQILFMKVADFAAVDTSVQLVAKHKQPQVRALKGLVNAVLRGVTREKEALLDEAARKITRNIPGWLKKSWSAILNEAEILEISRILVQDPPLDLTPRCPKNAAEIAAEMNADLLPNGSIRLTEGGDIRRLPGFAEGRWWVQDAAASLAVGLLGAVKGQNIADLCAAPGGKTLQLAAAGANVTAIDRSTARLVRLRENLARTGLSADVVTSDIRKFHPDAPFDGVLLDAPCSATGTLRRHPDVGWIKSASEIAALVTLQGELLDHALRLLAPGGALVYCVCSLQPAEGPEQIAAFLARTPDAALEPVEASGLPGLADAVTPEGYLRTLPSHWRDEGGMDGFFMARLRRLPGPLAGIGPTC